MRTKEEVVHAFTPVGKLDPSNTQKILRVEVLMRETAQELMDLVPESADRTTAMRKLLEAKMTCVQAISHVKAVPVQKPNPSAALKKEDANDKGKKSSQ